MLAAMQSTVVATSVLEDTGNAGWPTHPPDLEEMSQLVTTKKKNTLKA